jgi:lipopolysaccharide transport system ATP-binding protein
MSEKAIVVENLSKRYLLGHRSASHGMYKYTALRDELGRHIRNFARKTADMARGRQIVQGDEIEEFWALKNINFEVQKGEILGIIGRNGAGKSTLLKILSRITAPTEGRILLDGRVASLLEVGTGFHPELTGRENIFLNGAILGMTQREIRKKFDEIVAFAEVSNFLDTPVKFFSSGMYVRLAFAVAAHLEPEILIVDEVLAVGDVEFQRKCLGKINEVSQGEGRTVLFVSHNMEAVMKLCTRSIFFENGRIRMMGDAKTVVAAYLHNQSSSPRVIDLSSKARTAGSEGKARLVKASPSAAGTNWSIPFGEDLSLDLTLDVKPALTEADVVVAIHSTRGFEVATWSNRCSNGQLSLNPGMNTFRIAFQQLRLLPGQYFCSIYILGSRGYEDGVHEAVQFEVISNAEVAEIDAQNFGGAIVAFASVSVVEETGIEPNRTHEWQTH